MMTALTRSFDDGRSADSQWNEQGFTLIELLVTLVVAGILLTIGLPAFQDVLLGSKLKSYADSLSASAYLARGEAIKTNAPVTLCASSDGASCTGNWEQGWIVFRDANGDATVNGADAIIQKAPALSSGLKIVSSKSATSFTFSPTGISNFPVDSGDEYSKMTVCRASPSAGKQEMVVRLSATGMPSVTRVMNVSSCP
jgi:type IV fimbrial biogenesis protein FimT